MRKIVLVASAAMLAAVGTSCQSHPSEKMPADDSTAAWYEVRRSDGAAEFDFSRHSPLDFLDYLQRLRGEAVAEHGPDTISTCTVWRVPEDWIRAEHVHRLAPLIDSSEPCAAAISMISSHIPRRSDVGQEAAFLMAGFRKGTYPPAPASDAVEKDAVRKWYEQHMAADR
jgi:hypothetical protein